MTEQGRVEPLLYDKHRIVLKSPKPTRIMEQWCYSEEFIQASLPRICRLNRWDSLSAIVEAILSTGAPIVLQQPDPRCDDPSIKRWSFALRGPLDAVDAFFNGPQGYRAAYLQSDETVSGAIDRMIVDAILDRYCSTIVQTPGALESFRSSQAKVWIKQDQRVTDALRGRSEPNIEIAVKDWVARLDMPVETPRGERYLARAGVLATPGCGVLEVKGGWVTEGEEWIDPYKATSRFQQIRDYGFT